MSKDPIFPAKRANYNKCKNKGHFASKCRSARSMLQKKPLQSKPNVRTLKTPDSEPESSVYNKGQIRKYRITLNIGNVPLNMIIDSGATCNVIDINTWNFLKSQSQCLRHEKTDKKICG